jgi:ectoine hydroxylase-related dioxygenase (phytanoyl-CoA dioxygenase family)
VDSFIPQQQQHHQQQRKQHQQLSWSRAAAAAAPTPPTSSSSSCLPATTTNVYDDGIPSLYKEQERLLVERGIIEERIMTRNDSPAVAIEPSVTKGTGAAKGFGGGGGGGGSRTADLKAAAKIHSKELRKSGVVRIDNVFSDDMADNLLEYVTRLRSESEELVRTGQLPSLARFADVLLKHNRCDLTLPLEDDIIVDALTCVLEDSPVGHVISSTLGEDAGLYELSCLISDPGSQRQVMHPDTPYGKNHDPVLYTCFIALQDIDPEMGPTVFLPNTHTKEAHEQFQDDMKPNDEDESPKDRFLRTTPHVLGVIPKGTCTIFDSRLIHGGSANISDKRRAIFYCSFKSSDVGYAGNPGSIRKELISKFTLSTLQKELKQRLKDRKKSKLKTT